MLNSRIEMFGSELVNQKHTSSGPCVEDDAFFKLEMLSHLKTDEVVLGEIKVWRLSSRTTCKMSPAIGLRAKIGMRLDSIYSSRATVSVRYLRGVIDNCPVRGDVV